MAGRTRASLPAGVVAVWLPFTVVAAEVLVTYSRLPARELYHVSGSGFAGGASRALVFLNFPTALVAIAILALLFERLPGRAARGLAALALVLCAAVFWPRVVDQANLDAKPVNAVAAVGVVLTVVLAVSVARSHGLARGARQRGDGARVVVAAALVLLSAPWIAADLGFFLDGVPVLGSIYQTGEHRQPVPGLPPFPPAVHHGDHHGMDGLLLVLSALLLSRGVGPLRSRGLRAVLAAYLALMLCYGIGNIANDFWLEQVVKRGWTAWQIPNVLEPRASAAWGVIVVAAAVLWVAAALRSARGQGLRGPRREAGEVDRPPAALLRRDRAE